MKDPFHTDVHTALDAIEHECFVANTGEEDTRAAALFRILEDLKNIRRLIGPTPDEHSEIRGMVAATQGRTVEQ